MPEIEVVCQSAEDCRIAQESGADRIEFITLFELGGLTPTGEAVRQAVVNCSLPIVVMVRPRCGGFYYSQLEVELLLAEAKFWLTQTEIPIAGIVTGALNEDATLSLPILRQIADCKSERDLVCHRCFDLTPDPIRAMEQLIDLGFTRILTSGQKSSAEEGIELLHQLREHANGRIEILPGGGIRAENAVRILSETGCNQVHLGPFRSVKSVAANEDRGIDYGEHLVLDGEKIRRLKSAIDPI
jgi:copper homeostasis protein